MFNGRIDEFVVGIGVIAGLLAAFWKAFERFSRPHYFAWHRAMSGNVKILPLLTELRFRHDYASRVALLYTENGGGEPIVGGSLYSTMVEDSVAEGVQKYTGKWQRVRVENEYMHLLLRCLEDGHVFVKDTGELQDGSLKDSCLSEGIVSFDLYFIKATRAKWYYMAISHTDVNSASSPEYREDVRVLVQRMDKLIK